MVSKCYYHSSNDAADYLSKEQQPVVIINPHFPRSVGMHRRAVPNVISRFSFTATTVGQDLYLIGGQTAPDPTKNPIADNVVHVDNSLNVDQQNTKLAVQGHGAVSVGSNILIFFGQQSLTPQVLAAPIQQIDPTTGAITNFPNKGNIPASRFDHTVTVVNKKAYIIGGSSPTKGVLKDVSYFDLTTSTWHTLDATKFPDNVAISGHATIAVNNLLISCFGIDAKSTLRNDCIIFDTDQNDFVQANISGATPPPRSAATMIIGNSTSEILVFGGMDVKNKAAFNDMYILNASSAPTLTWQHVDVNANNMTFIPSPRGGHIAATLGNDTVMMVWGGIGQGRNMADSSMYFFDLTNMQWVGESDAENIISGLGNPNASSSNASAGSHDESSGAVIAAVLGTIIAIGLLIFYMIRRRRLRKTASFDRAVNNDPYIRPGGQLNESFSDLNDNADWYAGHSAEQITIMTHNNMEVKQPQHYADLTRRPSTASAESEKQMILHAQEMAKSLPPMPTIIPATVPKPDSLSPMRSGSLPSTPENTKASPPPNPLSMPTPTSVPYNPPISSPKSVTSSRSSDSSLSKKGHRRTSSVSLTATELAHHVFPNPPLRNSVTSMQSYGSQRPFHRPRSSLSQVFSLEDETDYELSSSHSKKPSTAASDVVHDICSPPRSPLSPLPHDEGSNGIPMQQHRDVDISPVDPELTNASNDDGYIESTQFGRHSYGGDFLDHQEVVAAYDGRRRDSEPFQFPPRNSTSEPSKDASEQDHANHERTMSYDRLQTIRESDVLDSYARESLNGAKVMGDPSISYEEKKRLSKQKKRSSGRVSFATVHEKIEFDETESSRSVSIANSLVSAIHEDSVDGDSNYEKSNHSDEKVTNSKDSNNIIRPLRLYEDEDESGTNNDSRISRFSFSVYDFTTDSPMPSNAATMIANVQAKKVDEYRPPSPVKRKASPDIRNSIAEVAIDGGVLYALI